MATIVSKNGYVDNGKPVSKGKRCPNCNSQNYTETISLEQCDDCKLEFNYWGGGGNSVYDSWSNRKLEEERDRAFLEKLEQQDRDRENGW
jgi:hypothetical protein